MAHGFVDLNECRTPEEKAENLRLMRLLQDKLLDVLNEWAVEHPPSDGLCSTVLGSLFAQAVVMSTIGMGNSEKELLLESDVNTELSKVGVMAIGDAAMEIIRKKRAARN